MNSEYREVLESLDPWIWMPGQPLPNLSVVGNQPYSAGQHPSVHFNQGIGRIYSGTPSAIPGEKGYLHPLSNLRHTNISGLGDLTAGFTCVAVVNPMELVNWGRIISFGRGFVNSEVIFSRNAGTNDLHIGWWNGNVSQPGLVTTGNRMPLNKEILVVGMYDHVEGKIKLFVDGEQMAERLIAPPASDTERKIVSFGGHCNNGEQWVGTITMPAIFLRALTDAEVMELARKSTLKPISLSGQVPLTPSVIGGIASVIGTASVGGGKVFQTEVDPDGSWEAVAQDVAVDLSYAGKLAAGVGYLAGGFPDAITRVEGVPASAEVRVIYRGGQGELGDGHLVAEVESASDGTWLVAGLNPNLKFDVVCRHEGYNDMILSNVSPALATGLEFAGSFTTLDDQVEIQLGVGPYQVDVVGGTPPIGVSFTAVGDFIVASGTPGNYGEFTFTLRVIDDNGLSGSFDSSLEIPAFDPHWDNVVSLLHFDGDFTDEAGRIWTGLGSIAPDGRFGAGLNTSAGDIQTPTDSWNDLSSGQGDFTVEMFIKQTAPNTAAALIAHVFSGSYGRFPFTIAFGKINTALASNELYFGFFNGKWIGANSTWEPVSNQWHHIAASREGDVYKLFADGVLIASFTSSTAVAANGSVLYMGRRWDNAGSGNPLFQGVIDEPRITKGVARYTENFTPPTAPFPNRGP